MAKIAVDFVLLEKGIHAASQRVHNLVFAPQHRPEIERDLGRFDSMFGQFFLRLPKSFTRFEQRLAGNAADSEAGAAQGSFLLHTSDIQAQLRRSNGSSITAGTSPDDDQTMLYWHKLDFGLCPLILQLVPRKAVRLTWDWTSGPICSSFRLCRMLPRTRCRALPPKP